MFSLILMFVNFRFKKIAFKPPPKIQTRERIFNLIKNNFLALNNSNSQYSNVSGNQSSLIGII